MYNYTLDISIIIGLHIHEAPQEPGTKGSLDAGREDAGPETMQFGPLG